GPCRVEMPHIEKVSREYQKKGLVVLGIDDEEAEVASAFLKKSGYTFNSLVDEEKAIAGLYQINAIPQSFFITKDGRIATHYRGTRSEADIRAGVERAFAGVIAAAEPEIKPSGSAATKLAPKLVSPQSGASLANGRSDQQMDHVWEFDWSNCPG